MPTLVDLSRAEPQSACTVKHTIAMCIAEHKNSSRDKRIHALAATAAPARFSSETDNLVMRLAQLRHEAAQLHMASRD